MVKASTTKKQVSRKTATKKPSAKTPAAKPVAKKPAAKQLGAKPTLVKPAIAPKPMGTATPSTAKTALSTAGSNAASSDASKDAATPTQVINNRELLARVAKRCDTNPNKIRDVYTAVLAELSEAMTQGGDLNLPPLGKIMINRKIEKPAADVFVCKIRRKRD